MSRVARKGPIRREFSVRSLWLFRVDCRDWLDLVTPGEMANLAKLHGHSVAGGVIGGEPLCVVVIVAIKRLVYVGGAIMREGKTS